MVNLFDSHSVVMRRHFSIETFDPPLALPAEEGDIEQINVEATVASKGSDLESTVGVI